MIATPKSKAMLGMLGRLTDGQLSGNGPNHEEKKKGQDLTCSSEQSHERRFVILYM